MRTAVEANAKQQPRHLTKEQTKEQRDKHSAKIQRRCERQRAQGQSASSTHAEMNEIEAMADEDYDSAIVDMGGYIARVCRPRDPAVAEAFKSLQRGGTTAHESTNGTNFHGQVAVMAQAIESFVPFSRDQSHRAISHTEGYYACLSGTHFL